MSRKTKLAARADSGVVEVKSKFDAEFRRFAVDRSNHQKFEDFCELLEQLHGLKSIPFLITYTDPEGDLLPINNNENFVKALSTAKPLLRLVIQHKGQSEFEVNGYGTYQRRKNVITKLLPVGEARLRPHIAIGLPEDFRRVSAIIDVDILPETQRRVKLMKNGSEKPLGFYIRDGTSIRVTPHGLEKVPGIFISRLVPGGLAEGTGLLAVNDEVLEVNGIEVAGKTLDQVTDMMVANSSNLIITIKPVNQHNNVSPHRGGNVRSSQKSWDSNQSVPSAVASNPDSNPPTADDDEDEIQDYVPPVANESQATVAKDVEKSNNNVTIKHSKQGSGSHEIEPIRLETL